MESIGGDSMDRKRLNVGSFKPILTQVFPAGFIGYDQAPMEKKPRTVLAENLRRLMAAHNLSTHALNRLSGVNQTTIARALREESAVTIDLLLPLAKAFQMPLWALLYPNLDPGSLPVPELRADSHAIEPDRLVKLIQAFDSLTDAQQDIALKEMADLADMNLALVRELGKRPRIAAPKPPQLEQQSKPPPGRKKKP
jgi:transcriptional regulator with XRE-family HTH domain